MVYIPGKPNPAISSTKLTRKYSFGLVPLNFGVIGHIPQWKISTLYKYQAFVAQFSRLLRENLHVFLLWVGDGGIIEFTFYGDFA
jgi:hypothetical protein